MPDGFSLKEAAAIADVRESVVRTALHGSVIAPRARAVGKAVRYRFDEEELFFIKLVAAFPLELGREDKRALRDMVVHRSKSAGRWRIEGGEFALHGDDVAVSVNVKRLRSRLAHDVAAYDRGRRRIVSDARILSGEPVFAGTRIPLAHIAGLVVKGVEGATILEEYPSLTNGDIEFARIWSRMKRDPGRPRRPIEMRRSKANAPRARRAPVAR